MKVEMDLGEMQCERKGDWKVEAIRYTGPLSREIVIHIDDSDARLVLGMTSNDMFRMEELMYDTLESMMPRGDGHGGTMSSVTVPKGGF